MDFHFRTPRQTKRPRKKILIFTVVLLALGLSSSGCMTMGWGGGYHSGSETPTSSSASLVKETEYRGFVLRAEFPGATANREVKYTFDMQTQVKANNPEKYEVAMVVSRGSGVSSGSSVTRVGANRNLSGNGRYVFTHRYVESGSYTISFEVSDASGPVTTLSADRYVSMNSTFDHHDNNFYRSPWFIGGSVLMLGIMVWMMSF